MSDDAPPAAAVLLDLAAVLRSANRAARAGGEAFLDREIGRRMAERLAYVKREPPRVLDAGCGRCGDLTALRARYPHAEIVGVDVSLSGLRAVRRPATLTERARAWFGPRPASLACADLAALPFASGAFGCLWSNLALPYAADPQAAFREWQRVLEPEGLLMFSAYGPDTLKELRAAFAAADARAHVHAFIDMHDLGDMLLAAGFADPVMDMEMITLEYADVTAIVADLRVSGQTNALAARSRGLLTPRAWSRMAAAYERERRGGRLPATVEVVYGHAWKGVPKRTADGRAVVRFDRRMRP
jgi:malonyl-CoA O-methyltransferase